MPANAGIQPKQKNWMPHHSLFQPFLTKWEKAVFGMTQNSL